MIAADPDLSNNKLIQGIADQVGPDGAFRRDALKFFGFAEASFIEVNGLLNANNKLFAQVADKLKSVDSRLYGIESLLKNVQATQWLMAQHQLEYARIQQEQAQLAVQLRTAPASGQLVAHLLNLAGKPEAAKAVNALTQAGLSLFKESQALVASLGRSSIASTVGGALVYTNGLVNIGIQLASALSGTPPELTIIRQQLDALAKQLDVVRAEMHHRFDLVDVRLRRLLVMSSQLVRESYKHTQDLEELQTAVSKSREEISRFRLSLENFYGDSLRQGYQRAIHSCLSYEGRTGARLPFDLGATNFVQCESDIPPVPMRPETATSPN